MKIITTKIAMWIYKSSYCETAEVLVRCLQQTKEEFLDYLWNEDVKEDSIKLAQLLAGQEVVKREPENLYDVISANREHILRDFNKLFWK